MQVIIKFINIKYSKFYQTVDSLVLHPQLPQSLVTHE